MRSGGLSTTRLGCLHEVMAGHIERGDVPGVVTLVSRREEVHVDAIGSTAFDGVEPMRRDTIFRIDSVTKPIITAAAAMILVEACRLRLDDPVDRWLPELADRRVLRTLDSPVDDTVPAHRPITLRDLLTFRLGFGILMAPPDAHPIQRAASEQQIGGMGPPKPATPHSPDEWMRRFATLPLIYQPGERWLYNSGFQVLGVLLARAAGMSLGEFLQERLFEPLGMKDTGFHVPAAKLDRLAACYVTDPETGAQVLHDEAGDSQWSRPPAFPDAAAGLVSTVDDLLAFGRMMLNDGRLGDARILSRPAVALMTTDQITPEQKAVSEFFPGFWDHRGWGFGVSIVTRRDELAGSPGRYGWDGGYGTSWYVDPKEELVGILLTQRLLDDPAGPTVFSDFWTGVYQAIAD
jgi:CubicO group peptidase (beta-lactamase class C family)